MTENPNRSTRRRFLADTALATSALLLPRRTGIGTSRRRRSTPRVGFVGVGNRGKADLDAIVAAGVEVTSLCDVDDRYLQAAAKEHERAATFADFRTMLENGPELDAVVVATADHTHAVATAAALRAGLDAYCEKPLTHSVDEARRVAELAARTGAVTQMGTQIHGWPNYHQVVDLLQRGVIGMVTEAHAFCGKCWSGGTLPEQDESTPDGLHWDLWLGPAPERPYHAVFHPAGWRGWWPFGSGTLGDMACHYLDLVFWALELSHCTSVRATGPDPDPVSAPPWLQVEWTFPSRGARPPALVTWSDGSARPPRLEQLDVQGWEAGVLFVGDRGWLLTDYTRRVLGPKSRFGDDAGASDAAGVDHHAQWVRAVRGEDHPACPFSYSGPLTETVLLGAVAHRLGNRQLAWDAGAMRCPDAPEAAALLRPERRDGWSV